MLSTKTRPNHYELLGLSPKASSGEIARAFARAVSSFQPRPFGSTAGVSVAYATLRDPVKRRAYDASIGLQPEPEPKPAVPTRLEVKYRREWAPAAFMAIPLAKDPPEAAHQVGPEALPLASPTPLPVERRAAEPALTIKEQVEELLARRSSDPDAAARPLLSEWSRPGLTIGALLLAAAAVGAFAGLKSVETIEPQPPAQAATVRLSPAKPGPAPAVEAPDAQAAPSVSAPQPRVPAANAPAPVRRQAATAPLAAMPADSIAESIKVVQVAATEPAIDSPAAEQAATATLPIARKDIARAIQRIGYSCGAVDSAVPVEGGGAGVFKVTCTSGATYRAAPIRGRYHFRKWNRR